MAAFSDTAFFTDSFSVTAFDFGTGPAPIVNSIGGSGGTLIDRAENTWRLLLVRHRRRRLVIKEEVVK